MGRSALGAEPSPSSAQPPVNGGDPFGLGHVWPAGEGGAETEGVRLQRPQEGECLVGVRLRREREGPPLSCTCCCAGPGAGPRACPVPFSDRVRRTWVVGLGVS